MPRRSPSWVPSPVLGKNPGAEVATGMAYGTGAVPALAVVLTRRFDDAADFVSEYADNLSRGGLFIKGDFNIAPLSSVAVEVTLPGFKVFTVQARVVHTVTAEVGLRYQAPPGVGLEIVDAHYFIETMRDFLFRLGRRRAATVLAVDERCRSYLEIAGFSTPQIPRRMVRDELCKAIALVVPKSVFQRYDRAVSKLGLDGLTVDFDYSDGLEPLLQRLDQRL